MLHPASLADMDVIVSFLAPIAGEAAGFLHILRTIRLVHTYQLVARLRQDGRWFRGNEEVILATVNPAYSCSSRVASFTRASAGETRHQ